MRSAKPSPARRLRSQPSRHDMLAAVAHVVDDASVDDPGHVLVHLQEPRSEVVLGLRSCDTEVHPFELVAGFTAPEDWWAFGMRVRGRAHHLDEPGRVTLGVATTFLVDRDGREVSVLRAADVATPLPGPAQGTIADLCRRVLALPTGPPPPTTALLWTAQWLDAVLAEWARPERRRRVSSGFEALASLHPAAGEHVVRSAGELTAIAHRHSAAWTWARLRHADRPLDLPGGGLPSEVARWMDDGFFARWTVGAFPSIATLATDLKALLGEPLGQQLLEAVVSLLDEAPSPP